MSDIFISYSRRALDFAQKIITTLAMSEVEGQTRAVPPQSHEWHDFINAQDANPCNK